MRSFIQIAVVVCLLVNTLIVFWFSTLLSRVDKKLDRLDTHAQQVTQDARQVIHILHSLQKPQEILSSSKKALQKGVENLLSPTKDTPLNDKEALKKELLNTLQDLLH